MLSPLASCGASKSNDPVATMEPVSSLKNDASSPPRANETTAPSGSEAENSPTKNRPSSISKAESTERFGGILEGGGGGDDEAFEPPDVPPPPPEQAAKHTNPRAKPVRRKCLIIGARLPRCYNSAPEAVTGSTQCKTTKRRFVLGPKIVVKVRQASRAAGR